MSHEISLSYLHASTAVSYPEPVECILRPGTLFLLYPLLHYHVIHTQALFVISKLIDSLLLINVTSVVVCVSTYHMQSSSINFDEIWCMLRRGRVMCVLLNCRYLSRKLHVITFQENVILAQVHRCVYRKRWCWNIILVPRYISTKNL